MIALKTQAGWLDLLPGTIGIEISNPYFRFDAVPGVSTYPFGLPMSPKNLRDLNFPHVVAAQGELVPAVPVEFYLDGLLWRLGSLVYQDYQPDKRMLQYQFVAAAGDLQTLIEGLKLGTMNLGGVRPLVLSPNEPDYALGTIRNRGFFGDQPMVWTGYLNYYANGAYPEFVAPQPRLVPLLRRVFAQVGYTLSGEWLTDPLITQLVLYSDRIADDYVQLVATQFLLEWHVPQELSPGQLLVELQKLFGLGYDFHPTRREIRITRLRDVATNPEYLVRDPGQLTRATPPLAEGYTLELGLEAGDELSKTLDTSWTKLVVGAGKTPLKAEAGTLHCVEENGQLLPALEGKGAGVTQNLNAASQCGLRLLFDRGNAQLTNGREAGSALALQWAGANGLYAQGHQAWLSFLDRAGREERLVPFRVGDLLSLDPARKELVGPRKYLWEKVSLSVSTTKRLETARFTYRPIRL
ncbi:hypothetical protein J0X19_22485 [Hymenobacter sp. BT186]|uniref:Uncharacterized protein n=1 Tax=Hymenobacter telluris TaxID=2816474 RepID=A0A939JD05_9BACT|nr:hypothetical protein [Hymenobacter telluris]MBO0360746.1 hypothetical protein [Hymenobacter telluris]MBW3376774.1 hypothetical protein [Hymenobacter norwichensis]